VAATCPQCGSLDIDLVGVLQDERRRVKCEACEHEWLRGEAKATPSEDRPFRDPGEAVEPTIFDNDDEGYTTWVRTWRGGYVLNCHRVPSRNYLMLHRADCETITEAGPQATTWTVNQYIKVCSTDPQRLRQWVREEADADPVPCQLCM
jgi:hypothetical protein